MEGDEDTEKHSPAHRVYACACNYDVRLQVHFRRARHARRAFVRLQIFPLLSALQLLRFISLPLFYLCSYMYYLVWFKIIFYCKMNFVILFSYLLWLHNIAGFIIKIFYVSLCITVWVLKTDLKHCTSTLILWNLFLFLLAVFFLGLSSFCLAYSLKLNLFPICLFLFFSFLVFLSNTFFLYSLLQ